jgi:phosphatidylglycerophosphate synthase
MKDEKKTSLHYFSDKELDKEVQFANFRTKLLHPILKFLDFLKIKPDHISYFAILLLIPYSIYFTSNPKMAVLLIWVYVLLDGVDGSLARYQKTSNNGGSFTDIVCDQLGLVVIVYNLLIFNFLDIGVGYWYSIMYLIMIVFSVIQNALKIKMQLLIRTKYIVYLMHSVWAFIQFDSIRLFGVELSIKQYYTIPLAVFGIIMLITNLISYQKLKNYLANN